MVSTYKNGLHTLVYKPFLEYGLSVDSASIADAEMESIAFK